MITNVNTKNDIGADVPFYSLTCPISCHPQNRGFQILFVGNNFIRIMSLKLWFSFSRMLNGKSMVLKGVCNEKLTFTQDCPQNIIHRVLFFSVVGCLKTNGVEIINWYDTFLIEGHTVFPTFNFVWKFPLVLSQSMSGLSLMKGDTYYLPHKQVR